MADPSPCSCSETASIVPPKPLALEDVVDALLESYESDARASHIGRKFLPSRTEIVEIVELLLQVFYPGYFGRQDLSRDTVRYHVGVTLSALREKLARQIRMCLCYQSEWDSGQVREPVCDKAAGVAAEVFLARLPALRRALLSDVQAAFDGDPAAVNLDEVVLAYPGLLAISVYRVAHELHKMQIPLMPRIMTEWAHSQTGADIHPGAEIAEGFFIDHATGVVIGETSQIGSGVKLYQGVTLGALSHPKDAEGRVIRGTKRHPTVENNVTIYANATVLGGSTVVGQRSLIGGSVFLTRSVPSDARVAMKAPDLVVKHAGQAPAPPSSVENMEYEI